ncbi:hypothetical protein AGOR_G00238180 [Albula goreensis]|uniref:C1q domain-containing protein n=1 Tax=Albula goreensis TaxID=1534307 RepID=A0A8T3CCV5_9TELE|nr:hypothetical protein AGOR_G00238180 [Albula goreensis]
MMVSLTTGCPVEGGWEGCRVPPGTAASRDGTAEMAAKAQRVKRAIQVNRERGESPVRKHGSHHLVSTTNKPIRFNKLFFNEQRHYDDTSGKFRCSIPGVYFFTYHLTVYPKDARVGLYKNDKAVMLTYDQFQENNVDQASGSIVLRLEAGDEVWLQVYGDEKHGGIYADNTNDSTFSGFLLYPNTPATSQRR